MIAYPVRAAGDGTERIVDAAGHVLGTVEIVAALNNPEIKIRRVERPPFVFEEYDE